MRRALRIPLLAILMAAPLLARVPAPTPQRFWLAGRYDGNRVIAYFNVVHFGASMPAHPRFLPPAVAAQFGSGFELTPADILRLRLPGEEPFALGSHYDVILGNGLLAHATVTTLLGFPQDEGVGNDSYSGALLTVDSASETVFALPSDYFVLRRPTATPSPAPRTPFNSAPGLIRAPVSFALQTQMAALLNRRRRLDLEGQPQKGTLAFAVQALRLASGAVRYYVRAE
jgi:hypothetical protein